MKRSIFAAMAILALLVSVPAPARANGVEQGKQFNIALVGLPDTCPTNATMSGELMIQMLDDGLKGKRLVALNVTAETPFGEANVFHATFRMERGAKRVVPVNIPVPENVPPGTYTFHVTVAVKGESLTVDHEVYIFNGK